MKKSMAIAGIALAGLFVTGCVSSGDGNPVVKWQSNRFMAKEISTITDAGKVPTVGDLSYQSTLSDPELAGIINVTTPVIAALYAPVVNGVDKMDASQEGRKIAVAIENDVAAGQARKDVMAALTPEQKTALLNYTKYLQNTNVDILIQTAKEILAKLAVEGQNVAGILQKVKDNPKFAQLSGMDLMKMGSALSSDGKALGAQVDDATAGANLWMKLLMEDKAAKAHMADYPTE